MKAFFYFIFLMPVLCIAQKRLTTLADINKVAFKTLHAGIKPDFIAIDGDDAWVINDHQNRILKLSPFADSALLKVAVPEACSAPVVGFNALWIISCTERKLYKVDHIKGTILAKIATGIADENGEMSLAAGGGYVWLLGDSAGLLLGINPSTNKIEKRLKVKPHSYCVAFADNFLWVTNYFNNSVQKIAIKTNKVIATINVGKNPRFITATKKWIWTLNQGDGTITKIDAVANKVVASIDVKAKGGGGDIIADKHHVWVTSTNAERPIQLINTTSNKIETIFTACPHSGEICKVDGAIRIAKKYVWISGYYNQKVWLLKK